ncbi:MAG: hypothetical protein PHO74_03890 [Weeksellaceae bacterium]|nr:hypothetical protein [Weeksellaceae bacterium]
MKHPFCLILLSTLVWLSSCGETASQYNDALIRPQLQIEAYIDTIFKEHTSYKQIGELRKKLIEQAELGLTEAIKSEDYKGNGELKNVAAKYYSYTVSYFDNEELDSIFYLLNTEERLKKIDSSHLVLIQKELNNYLKINDELLDAQNNFAKEFGLNLTQ